MALEEAVWVDAPGGKYPIVVGYDLLAQSDLFEPYVSGKQVFILSHQDIAQTYLGSLIQTLQNAKAHHIDHLLISCGDHHKTLETANQIWTFLLSHHHHRDTVIIALGGGMIGDMAGFCGACYMRGVQVIQCPTTLLAQIDAAIGGKTGVNHPLGKNMIGAFHQPLAVLSDLGTLRSLPEREFVCALAELIKYGLILDASFFDWIEKHFDGLLQKQQQTLKYAVTRASQIKANVVSHDEKESNQRRMLNFGHTIAHALESLLDYQQIKHGEAVAIGMVVATHLSIQKGNITYNVLERLILLLQRAGLPVNIPKGITIVEILTKMKHDKKHSHQRLQWVLIKTIGNGTICDEVTPEQITQAMEMCITNP